MVDYIYKVGDEVDFYCKKCRLNLRGNVAAVREGQIVRVTCRTCRSTQPYVPEKTEEELRATTLRKVLKRRDQRGQQRSASLEESRKAASYGSEVTERWRKVTEGIDSRQATKYDRHKGYKEGAVIIHTEHGLGVVQKVLHENAILVLFRKVEVPLEMNAPEEES